MKHKKILFFVISLVLLGLLSFSYASVTKSVISSTTTSVITSAISEGDQNTPPPTCTVPVGFTRLTDTSSEYIVDQYGACIIVKE